VPAGPSHGLRRAKLEQHSIIADAKKVALSADGSRTKGSQPAFQSFSECCTAHIGPWVTDCGMKKKLPADPAMRWFSEKREQGQGPRWAIGTPKHIFRGVLIKFWPPAFSRQKQSHPGTGDCVRLSTTSFAFMNSRNSSDVAGVPHALDSHRRSVNGRQQTRFPASPIMSAQTDMDSPAKACFGRAGNALSCRQVGTGQAPIDGKPTLENAGQQQGSDASRDHVSALWPEWKKWPDRRPFKGCLIMPSGRERG